MTKEQSFEEKIKKIVDRVSSLDWGGDDYTCENAVYDIEQAHKQELKEILERMWKDIEHHLDIADGKKDETCPRWINEVELEVEIFNKIKEEYKL